MNAKAKLTAAETTPVRLVTVSKTTPAKKATPAPAKKAAAKKAAAKKALPMPEGFAVGDKVTSTRDGGTYTVAGPDRSSSYVIVFTPEGKRLARAIKTLKKAPARARKAVAVKPATA